MTINQAALDLIKTSEGFVDHWYPDPASNGPPMTCCYGHTSQAGPPRYADNPARKFSEAEGEAILQQDLAATEHAVGSLVKVALNENEYGALVSFAFNIGGGNFSTSTMLRMLNAGDKAGAAAEFPRWNHAGGKVLPGLTIRRDAEMKLFLTPIAASPAPVSPLPRPTPMPAPKPAPTGFWQALLAILSAILSLFKRKP